MPQPLVAIAVAFAAGIVLSIWIEVSLAVSFSLLAAAAGGALVAYLFDRDGKGRRLTSGLALAAWLAAGLFWVTLDRTTHQSRLLDDQHTHLYLTGTVAAEPQVYSNRIVYTLDATEARQGQWQEDLREKVQVVYYLPREEARKGADGPAGRPQHAARARSASASSGGTVPLFAYGDVLQVFGQLGQPPVPRNPGEFNYRTYLARQGVFTRLAVDDPEDITLLATGQGNPFVSLALAAKQRAVAAIEAALPYPEAGVLQAMLFGDREKLDDQEVDLFQSLGVFHLFAVSGLHIGFLLVFILALVQLLGLGRWGRFILGGLLLLFYAAVTGFTPSVTRASIMAGMVLLGRALGEKTDFYTDLALAALVILALNPQALFLSGFQMSFLAAWGIVYLYPLIHDPLEVALAWRAGRQPAAAGVKEVPKPGPTPSSLHNSTNLPGPDASMAKGSNRAEDRPVPVPEAKERNTPATRISGMLRGLAESISISAAAQLAVTPLLARYFNLVSPGALLANLVVVPLAGLAVILGLMVFFAAQLNPALGSLFAYASGALISLILAMLKSFAVLPGMAWPVATPPGWAVAPMLAVLVAAREGWVHRSSPKLRSFLRQALPVTAATTIALTVIFLLLPTGPGHLRVTFLDVGQGSSIYIETPAGRHLLVDGGGVTMPLSSEFDVGKDILQPFLIRQGVRRLDLLVSTHPDADHIQGLETVIAGMPVSLAVTPPVDWFGEGYRHFLQLAGGFPSPSVLGGMLAGTGEAGSTASPATHPAGNRSPVPVVPVTRGCRFQVDPTVEITILHPAHSFSSTRSDDNNASLVLRVAYGQIAFLLTGDIETEAMQELVEQQDELLASDVLLLPHHGSRYSFSPEFYAKVSPAAVVAQVGENNNFGHPAPDVVKFWEARGIPVYRTDRRGAIIFTADGENLWVETMIEDPSR